MIIWFASGNAHKQEELAAILNSNYAGRPAAVEKVIVKIPAEAGIPFDPDETGGSFLENALLKARALYRIIAESCRGEKAVGTDAGVKTIADNIKIIADDSGLCVDALGGRPGIYSARYGCENGKKIEAAGRNALLLRELGENPNRKARFVCAMVLLLGPERFYAVQETLEGALIREQHGTGGFGYDPIFLLPEKNLTVAELPPEEKNILSHRGRAGRAIAKFIHGEG